MEEFTCCICKQKVISNKNNPEGSMGRDKEGNIVSFTFNSGDYCCDDCNTKYVIPGRLYKLQFKKD